MTKPPLDATGSPEPANAAPAKADLSLDQFSRMLDTVYEAALDPAGWTNCLDLIRRELAGNYASLIVRPGSADDIGMIVSNSQERRSIALGNPYIMMSPFTGMPADRLVTIPDVLSDADWRASSYYKDWCQPLAVFHVMAADIEVSSGAVYGFRITRPETAPPFSPQDLELGRRLLPHIKRALNLHLSIHQDRKVISLYSHAMAQLMVGVIVLDQDRNVIECNPAATAILEMNDGLRVAGNQLDASYPNENRNLQRLIRDALIHPKAAKMSLTDALAISRPSGEHSWGVVVQSIASDQWTEGKQRPTVAVFVRDAEGQAHPPIRLTQQLFQLTPAETALAIELANGLSLDEASDVLGIKRNTARAHLRSIFSKTGVRRQTELVRIFLNSVAWLGTRD
jgi:DNA-binding CsgD family transcriptional regulator/PAS domain-containing protein